MSSNDRNDLFAVADKTVLITGGTSGIGLMMAEALVANGADVTVVARSAADCAATAQALGEHGHGLPGDLGTTDGIRAIAETFANRHDRLDILVNNAGTFQPEPIEQATEAVWDMSLDLNVKAGFFLTRAMLPLLRAAASAENPARIVNIASGHGMRVSASFEAYAYQASKAGVLHLTRGLAARLAREAITVNAIAPGVFPSRLTADFDEETMAAIGRGIPLGRPGTPPDIAGAILYLCSRAGAYVSGVVLPVDGGWVGCA